MRFAILATLLFALANNQTGFGQETENSSDSAKPKNVCDLVQFETWTNEFRRVKLKHKTFSPDKKYFAGFYRDGWDEIISVHDAKSKKQIKRIVGHGDNVARFKFSGQGKLLATFDKRKGWKVWEVSSGKLLMEL